MLLKKLWQRIYAFIKTDVPKFLNKNFEVSSSKRSKKAGLAVAFLTLLPVVIFVKQFTSQEFSSKWWILAFNLVMPFVLGLCTAFTVRLKNELVDKIWHLVFLLISIQSLMMIITKKNVWKYLKNFMTMVIFMKKF